MSGSTSSLSWEEEALRVWKRFCGLDQVRVILGEDSYIDLCFARDSLRSLSAKDIKKEVHKIISVLVREVDGGDGEGAVAVAGTRQARGATAAGSTQNNAVEFFGEMREGRQLNTNGTVGDFDSSRRKPTITHVELIPLEGGPSPLRYYVLLSGETPAAFKPLGTTAVISAFRARIRASSSTLLHFLSKGLHPGAFLFLATRTPPSNAVEKHSAIVMRSGVIANERMQRKAGTPPDRTTSAPTGELEAEAIVESQSKFYAEKEAGPVKDEQRAVKDEHKAVGDENKAVEGEQDAVEGQQKTVEDQQGTVKEKHKAFGNGQGGASMWVTDESTPLLEVLDNEWAAAAGASLNDGGVFFSNYGTVVMESVAAKGTTPANETMKAVSEAVSVGAVGCVGGETAVGSGGGAAAASEGSEISANEGGARVEWSGEGGRRQRPSFPTASLANTATKPWTPLSLSLWLLPSARTPIPPLCCGVCGSSWDMDSFGRRYRVFHLAVANNASLVWYLCRRFSEFLALHAGLVRGAGGERIPRDRLPKPPTRTFGLMRIFPERMESFRKNQLDTYIQEILLIPEAVTNRLVLSFLGLLTYSRYDMMVSPRPNHENRIFRGHPLPRQPTSSSSATSSPPLSPSLSAVAPSRNNNKGTVSAHSGLPLRATRVAAGEEEVGGSENAERYAAAKPYTCIGAGGKVGGAENTDRHGAAKSYANTVVGEEGDGEKSTERCTAATPYAMNSVGASGGVGEGGIAKRYAVAKPHDSGSTSGVSGRTEASKRHATSISQGDSSHDASIWVRGRQPRRKPHGHGINSFSHGVEHGYRREEGIGDCKEEIKVRAVVGILSLEEAVQGGDVLLFRCRGPLNRLQRWLLRSEWNHVGVVVSLGANRPLQLLESTPGGVGLYPLVERVREYQGLGFSSRVAFRRLSCPNPLEARSRLQSFARQAEGKAYGISLPFSTRTLPNNRRTQGRKNGDGRRGGNSIDVPESITPPAAEDWKLSFPPSSYLCSQLVGAALSEMGVLRVGGECRGGEEGWLRLLPGAFGQGRSVERGLAVGVSLGEEVLVDGHEPEVAGAVFLSDALLAEDEDSR